MMAKIILFPQQVSSLSAVVRKVLRKGTMVQSKQQPDPYLNTEEVAKLLGYSVRTITEWAQRYQDTDGLEGIPAFKFSRAWRFDKARMEAWIADKKNDAKRGIA